MADPDNDGQVTDRRLNRQMLFKLLVIAVLMFGFGYGLIPVYKKICEVTGVNFLTPKDITYVTTNLQLAFLVLPPISKNVYDKVIVVTSLGKAGSM